eukprot:gene1738-507_t
MTDRGVIIAREDGSTTKVNIETLKFKKSHQAKWLNKVIHTKHGGLKLVKLNTCLFKPIRTIVVRPIKSLFNCT